MYVPPLPAASITEPLACPCTQQQSPPKKKRKNEAKVMVMIYWLFSLLPDDFPFLQLYYHLSVHPSMQCIIASACGVYTDFPGAHFRWDRHIHLSVCKTRYAKKKERKTNSNRNKPNIMLDHSPRKLGGLLPSPISHLPPWQTLWSCKHDVCLSTGGRNLQRV